MNDMRKLIAIAEGITPNGWLYHGTSAAAAVAIVFDDQFQAEDTHGDGLGLGLSLTRSLVIARRFAEKSSDEVTTNGGEDWAPGWAESLVDGTGGVVISFERRRIAKLLMPVDASKSRVSGNQNFGYTIAGNDVRDEEEERMVPLNGQTNIAGARKLISGISLIDKTKFDEFAAKLQTIAPKYQNAITFIVKLTRTTQ